MDNETYERIGLKMDALFETHDPFKDEQHRQEFRDAWVKTLQDEGVAENDWMTELERRLGQKTS